MNGVETDAPIRLSDNPDTEHTKAPRKYVRNADRNVYKLGPSVYFISLSFSEVMSGDLPRPHGAIIPLAGHT
jgi:hypothetical protein